MKYVFVVGCPRSGTSWIQLLLAQHSQVVTTRETHLFNGYLRRLEQAWTFYKLERPDVGLTQLLSEADFYALCADFAKNVLDRVAEKNPAATVLLEKTPTHLRVAPLILKLLPGAYFIHVVRDPRSVVSSLCAAGRSWGRDWASTRVADNARSWRSDVTLGRKIRELTDRYREIRYEDLHGDGGAATLQRMFSWVELPVDEGFAARAVESCRIDRVQGGGNGLRSYDAVRQNSAGFFRRGTVDGWKEDLSGRDVEVIEYVTKDLMRDLSYPFVSGVEKAARKPLRLAANEVLDGLESAIRSGTDRSFKKLRSVL